MGPGAMASASTGEQSCSGPHPTVVAAAAALGSQTTNVVKINPEARRADLPALEPARMQSAYYHDRPTHAGGSEPAPAAFLLPSALKNLNTPSTEKDGVQPTPSPTSHPPPPPPPQQSEFDPGKCAFEFLRPFDAPLGSTSRSEI